MINANTVPRTTNRVFMMLDYRPNVLNMQFGAPSPIGRRAVRHMVYRTLPPL
jgi:hypothetical protein